MEKKKRSKRGASAPSRRRRRRRRRPGHRPAAAEAASPLELVPSSFTQGGVSPLLSLSCPLFPLVFFFDGFFLFGACEGRRRRSVRRTVAKGLNITGFEPPPTIISPKRTFCSVMKKHHHPHLLVGGVVAIEMTITNNCNETLWIATNGNPSLPATNLSFVLVPKASTSVFPIDTWKVSVWAQTNCTVGPDGRTVCTTGGCSGNQLCKGQLPDGFSLTEANIFLNQNSDGVDRYEVSIDRGFNVPMALVPSSSSTSYVVFGLQPSDVSGCRNQR